jgi:hypothetical protein
MRPYRDVTTDQCLGRLADAGFDAHCRHPDGSPAEVSYVLRDRPAVS